MIKINDTQIKGVIFDMDGLMFDTERVYTKTWPPAAKDFGYTVTEDVVEGAIGLNAEAGCEYFKSHYGKDFPFYEIRVHRLNVAMDYIRKNGLSVKKGLYELISYLKENNIKIALATSSERERTNEYLEISKLTDTFDYVVCGDEVKLGKPNPDIFLTAASKIDVDIKNCIVLEDSYNGLRAAYASGAYPVMIPDCKEPTEEILKIIHKVFRDLDEFRAYLIKNS